MAELKLTCVPYNPASIEFNKEKNIWFSLNTAVISCDCWSNDWLSHVICHVDLSFCIVLKAIVFNVELENISCRPFKAKLNKWGIDLRDCEQTGDNEYDDDDEADEDDDCNEAIEEKFLSELFIFSTLTTVLLLTILLEFEVLGICLPWWEYWELEIWLKIDLPGETTFVCLR